MYYSDRVKVCHGIGTEHGGDGTRSAGSCGLGLLTVPACPGRQGVLVVILRTHGDKGGVWTQPLNSGSSRSGLVSRHKPLLSAFFITLLLLLLRLVRVHARPLKVALL